MFIAPRRAFAASIVALSMPLAAQTGAPVLSLVEAQRLALARSSQLLASDAAAAALRESAVAAGQLPDPVLRLGIDNLPVNGPDRWSPTRDFMTMRRIGLMQELPRSEKRQLRVERAERDAQRVQAERTLAVATIERETALAWFGRWYALATLELLRQLLEESRLQVQGAEIALRNGRGNPAEIFAGRAALASLQDRQRQSEQQARSAALMLARWVGPEAAAQPLAGVPGWRQPARPLPEPGQPPRHPQLAILAAQVAAAETELRQAEAETRPDWTVEASYQQRGPGYANMVSIGVSVPLQLGRANRQERTVAAKAASLAEARARLDDGLLAYGADLQVAQNDWQAGRDRVDRLVADLLPAARQRTEAALASYRSGRVDLAAALASRREEIDARLQVLALEMETARQWVGLRYLTTSSGEQP